MPIDVNQTVIDRIEELRSSNNGLTHPQLFKMAMDEFKISKVLGNTFHVQIIRVSDTEYEITNLVDKNNPITTITIL